MSQHPSFAAAVDQQIDLVAAVREYRTNQVALRRLDQVRPTRNAGATLRATVRRLGRRNEIELALVLSGNHDLVGYLTEERKLLKRIAKAKRAGIERPELALRLTVERGRIAAALLGS